MNIGLAYLGLGNPGCIANAIEFEQGCLELAALLPHPFEQIKTAALQVAYESSHSNHSVPDHLKHLILSKWFVEGLPEQVRWLAVLNNPTDCEQGCVARFYAYLDKLKKEQEG